MIAIDTNLLVYSHRTAYREHAAAQRAIREAGESPRGWGVALGSVTEFWSIVTHPSCAGGPTPPRNAALFINTLVADGAKIFVPGDAFWSRLAQLAIDLDVRGARIYDLQIALTAFDNGASEIWTHDRTFAAFPGIRVYDPL